MPVFSIPAELADFYGIDIREILSGERKGKKTDNGLKDTPKQAAECGETEKEKLNMRKVNMPA